MSVMLIKNKLLRFLKLINNVNSSKETIEKLDESRIYLQKEFFNKTSSLMYVQAYDYYSSVFTEKYGTRPFKGKWDIRFDEPVIDESYNLCTSKGEIPIYGGSIIAGLANPDSPYLDNSTYFGFIEIILKFILYAIALNIMNLTPVAKALVRIINDSIGYEYIVLNCKDGLGSYTCGRAISSIHMEKPCIPRLVIFNTISTDDDLIDTEYYKHLITETDGKLNLDNGKELKYYSSKYIGNYKLNQEQNYYNKYLKYKLKYLQLKNK